jgi:hypothetical protein
LDEHVGPVEQAPDLATVVAEHRAWLVRRLALIVGDAVEAEDLALTPRDGSGMGDDDRS